MKAFALCGIILVIGDVLLTISLGALNPGYDHVRQFISELGEAGRPFAWLFAIWSVIYGALFAEFSVGLVRSLKGQSGARIGGAALFAVALTSAADGIFPCDPGCSPQTLSGITHIVAGAISLVAIALAPFFIARAMMTAAAWRGYSAFTFCTGCTLCSLSAWLACCFLFGVTEAIEGAVQRALVLALYTWIAVLSVRIWRLANVGPT